MSGLIIDSDESFIRVAKDFPPVSGFDLIDKTASRIAVSLGLSNGVSVHIVLTEQALPGDILKQAAEEGALGTIVAVHQGRDIYLVSDRHTSITQSDIMLSYNSEYLPKETDSSIVNLQVFVFTRPGHIQDMDIIQLNPVDHPLGFR
jgi:hypothetical protein